MNLRQALSLAALAVSLPSAAYAADCRLFSEKDRGGLSFDADAPAPGTDAGHSGLSRLPDTITKDHVKSIWLRKGYALQTFRGTDFQGLAWTDTFIPRTGDTIYVPVDDGYLINVGDFNSLEVRSLRCFRAPDVTKNVRMGGQYGGNGYRLDFYNDAKFAYSSGSREWTASTDLTVTSVDGKAILSLTQDMTRYTRTNGGPGVPPEYTKITYQLDLDSGVITVNDNGSKFPGNTVLPVGTDNVSSFAYDAALNHMASLLDNYVRERSSKGQVRDYRDMLRQLQRVPYLGSKYFRE